MGNLSSSKKNPKKAQPKPPQDFISWFEIPAYDLHRAVAFYNFIYGMKMEVIEQSGYAMALFPTTTEIGGAIVTGPGCIPSELGSLIYLNGGDDLAVVLEKVAQAGGRVILPKTLISEDHGYFGLFMDSEGNKMALHSNA